MVHPPYVLLYCPLRFFSGKETAKSSHEILISFMRCEGGQVVTAIILHSNPFSLL